ncbi:hypothetical protein MAPG_04684 [Magnaporthiopsis poae ATCC 64411]|uniref:BZIP domain-containing protein n=1 Tax=Magnaporthiopsis poae (strain ATCC 64411 / 73-15) TaxID=644358 RepID=A0A0C4DXD9_MAGP6|nr:hypothetical protein MAPG_04684 [Magnaporthiopsis poae ATCC 64411]
MTAGYTESITCHWRRDLGGCKGSGRLGCWPCDLSGPSACNANRGFCYDENQQSTVNFEDGGDLTSSLFDLSSSSYPHPFEDSACAPLLPDLPNPTLDFLDQALWDPAAATLDPATVFASVPPVPALALQSPDSFGDVETTPSLASSVSSLSPKEPLGDSLLFGDLVAPSPPRNASSSPAVVVAEKPGASSSSAKTNKNKNMPPAPAMSVFSVKTAGGGRKRSREQSTGDGDDDDDAALADKRRRNNAAAAKYRQKKLDRISELEEAVAEVSKERDELKLQLARRDEEIRILREMLMAKK